MGPVGRDNVKPNRVNSEGLIPLVGAMWCDALGRWRCCWDIRAPGDGAWLLYLVAKTSCEDVLRMLLNGANINPDLAEGIDRYRFLRLLQIGRVGCGDDSIMD